LTIGNYCRTDPDDRLHSDATRTVLLSHLKQVCL